jgi:hypothetical protein
MSVICRFLLNSFSLIPVNLVFIFVFFVFLFYVTMILFLGWGEIVCWCLGCRWPIVPAMDDKWEKWSIWWSEKLQERLKFSEKF